MRYHYTKPELYLAKYGKTYVSDHPVYKRCTLYLIKDRGLAVIQQRHNPHNKTTWWSEIDMWLVDDLYLHPNFKSYFDRMSGPLTDGVYPTVTIRQIMWALRMKPLPKQRWETTFDRKFI